MPPPRVWWRRGNRIIPCVRLRHMPRSTVSHAKAYPHSSGHATQADEERFRVPWPSAPIMGNPNSLRSQQNRECASEAVAFR